MIAGRRLFQVVAPLICGLCWVGGCQRGTQPMEETTAGKLSERRPALPSANYLFARPIRLEAEGDFVSVEAPGYACPTIGDVDGDGVDDLVVGQFNQGNLQFFKNLSTAQEAPRLAAAQWIKQGENRAVVPGVW